MENVPLTISEMKKLQPEAEEASALPEVNTSVPLIRLRAGEKPWQSSCLFVEASGKAFSSTLMRAMESSRPRNF